jgi:hypothetical protein
MKPDKKKELPTEEYQRPPLLEEIKKFKKELKLVSSFVLSSVALATIIAFWNKVASLLANISLFFGNIWNWIQNLITSFVQYLEAHSSDILLGILLVILVAFSTYLLKESIVNRYYIYSRYRIGHYSRMMWSFIGGGLIQLFTILLVVETIWSSSFVTALLVYIISFVFMLIFIKHTKQKLLINKPKLEKPLTRVQNNSRKLLNDFLYFNLFSQQGNFLPFYEVCSRESDYQNVAEQIAKFAFIADTMPEELPKGLGCISGRLLDEVIDSESTIISVDFKAYMLTRCVGYFDTICEPLQEDELYVKYKEQAHKMLLQLKKQEKYGFYSIDSSYEKYTKFFE